LFNEKKWSVWLWAAELHDLGCRRKSDGYWQCQRRFGLPDHGHLSLFASAELRPPGKGGPRLVELSTFHVTFEVHLGNVHFYYHECRLNAWEPGGHTSAAELRRLGCDPVALRDLADAVAAEFVAGLGGAWHPRPGEPGTCLP
jgi:hypothetical protein